MPPDCGIILSGGFFMVVSEKIGAFPEKPGVYIMKDKRGKVIYVGKAVSLRQRVRSYFQSSKNLPVKVAHMVTKIEDIEYITTDTEVEALILECNLIKFHRPKYNVLLRDDKQYPYIKVTLNEPFPRLQVVRRIKKDGAKYFGPYADVGAMRQALDVISKVFPIRGCKKDLSNLPLRDRPCLNFHINRCLAPCQGKVEESDYREIIKDIITFLEGRHGLLVEQLKEKMDRASKNLDFELAAVLRNQIDALEKIQEKQKIVSSNMIDQDVVAMTLGLNVSCVHIFFIREGKLIQREPFIIKDTDGVDRKEVLTSFIKQFYDNSQFIPKQIIIEEDIDDLETIEEWLSGKKGSKVDIIIPRRGEKKALAEMVAENARLYLDLYESTEVHMEAKNKKALDELRSYLKLQKAPYRIEGFDVSNIQGAETVASMVVFEGGVPKKQDYRKFKIYTVKGSNDFESIKEAVYRRFKRGLSGDEKFRILPDLLVVDGGKGQLHYAIEALKELNLKQIPTVSIAEQFEYLFVDGQSEPIILPDDSEALYLLQRVRDEAHRFAVTFHRSLRSKKNLHSVLDDIPGIGNVRRKALINAFGSIDGIKTASLEELSKVKGMTSKSAQDVYDYFHK